MKLYTWIRCVTYFMAATTAGCGRAPDRHSAQLTTSINQNSDSLASDEATAYLTGPSKANLLLPIPPREQWSNANGYCGETSIQSIALYYGAWISQQIVRDVGGGEILLGENVEQALTTLHFRFTTWDNESKSASFANYMLWLKSNIIHGFPAIFAAYLTDGGNASEYDHIMPATGIKAHNAALNAYDRADILVFNTNFDTKALTRSFGSLAGTRTSCKMDSDHGGCIPAQVDYGTAVTGIIDAHNLARPVRLTVDAVDEPNVSLGKKPMQIHGSLIVSGLSIGKKYALLRYNDYSKVPENDDLDQYLSSAYVHRLDFTASDITWTYADQEPINTNEAVYYRAIEIE